MWFETPRPRLATVCKHALLAAAHQPSFAICFEGMILSVFAPFLLATFGLGAAVPPATPDARAITTLSNTNIASFLPYTRFAAVAYCPPSLTLPWSCGANCKTNPSFIPIAAGGDGDKIQFCECTPLSRRAFRVCSRLTRVLAVQGMSGSTRRRARLSFHTKGRTLPRCTPSLH